MRAVVDLGVYVSAALSSQGAPAHLMRRWRLRQFDIFVCPALLAELDRTLRRDEFRRYIALDDVDALVEELERRAEPADDPTDVPPISRDPGDDYLIALAVAAEVDVLVPAIGISPTSRTLPSASSRPELSLTSSSPPRTRRST